jgi:Flp pilus assembly protein TadD
MAGDCLAKLGRHREAEEEAMEAVRLAPDSVPSRNLLAVELSENGKQAEAIQQFREVARLAPGVYQVQLNLGIALAKGGQNAEAIQVFQEVLKHNPTNEIARSYLQSLRNSTPKDQ